MLEDIGQCRWRYAIVDGVKTDIRDAKRCQHGLCPLCGDELIARKGERRAHHWWHVKGKCDDWYQPKGPWHIYWQNKFPVEMQEVPVSKLINGRQIKHIADIKTGEDLVIEVQYSPIMASEVKEREQFYGKMLWLISMMQGARFSRFAEVTSTWGQNYKCRGQDHWILDDKHGTCIPSAWENSGKFLWLDCHGSMQNPESDEDLVCVVPRATEDTFRLYTYVPRNEFMKMCYNDQFKLFEEELLVCRDKYRAEHCEGINKKVRKVAQKNRKAWEVLRNQYKDYENKKREEYGRRIDAAVSSLRDNEPVMNKTVEYGNRRFKDLLRTHNEFVWESKDALPLVRMELPWLVLWVISKNHIFTIPMGDFKIDGLCRVELCLKNGYSFDDYNKDLEWLKVVLDEPALNGLPQFEKLKPHEGRMLRVGLVQPDLSGDKALLRFNKLKTPDGTRSAT